MHDIKKLLSNAKLPKQTSAARPQLLRTKASSCFGYYALLRGIILSYVAKNEIHHGHHWLHHLLMKTHLVSDWEKHTPCVQIHKVIDKYSMIADGLSTLSESLRDVRGNYQATKRSTEIGVDALEGQVNDIGKRQFSNRSTVNGRKNRNKSFGAYFVIFHEDLLPN